jgi:hypothetical protein
MADLRMVFIEENEAADLNKYKKDSDTDMRPNETPSEWIKRIKEMNNE